MSTAYNIHLMHMSQDLRETINENHWREIRERREKNIQERQELLEKIEAYGFATEAAFDKWYDEAPNENFLQYCRDEWQAICAEREKAYGLVNEFMNKE